MRGKAVPQRMEAYRLVDSRLFPRHRKCALHGGGVERTLAALTREEPPSRLVPLPVGTQRLQERGGEHHVPILATFAALHTDHHTVAVDVGELEAQHLTQ